MEPIPKPDAEAEREQQGLYPIPHANGIPFQRQPIQPERSITEGPAEDAGLLGGHGSLSVVGGIVYLIAGV